MTELQTLQHQVQILSSRLEQVEKERNRALGANRELIAQLGTALAESKRFQQAATNERQCRLQLERTVELLKARRHQGVHGWQPIQTAPKDGTEVWLLFAQETALSGDPWPRVRAAHWSHGKDWSIPYYSSNPPTHWHPQAPPAPPAAG